MNEVWVRSCIRVWRVLNQTRRADARAAYRTSSPSAATNRSFSRSVPTVTRSAFSRPSEPPARTSTPRSRSPVTTSPLDDPVGEPEPDEVGVGLGDPQAEPAHVVDERAAGGDRLHDAPLDLVLVHRSASTAAAWAAAVQVERLADLVDRDAEILGAAQRVADAQAGEPVDLGEGPQQHEVRVPAQQLDRGVGVAERQRELAVGLVEDHAHVRRDLCRGSEVIASRSSAVEVGLFGLQTSTSRVATVTSWAIASRSWRSSASSGTWIARRARCGREMRIDAERRPRVDELGARLEQRLAGGEQDVAGAVAERDPLRRDAVAVRQRCRQRRRRTGRGSGGAPARPASRRPTTDLGSGANGDSLEASIATSAPEVVARGDRIDRDAADALCELDRHRPIYCADSRSARSARASPR